MWRTPSMDWVPEGEFFFGFYFLLRDTHLSVSSISAIMESVTDDSGEKPSKHKHDQRHLKRVDDASV